MNRTYGESGTPGEGAAKHLLHLDGREKLKITGVENVDSFEETCAVLQTGEGLLTVDGENLHIERLDVDKGEVEMDGRVYGLYYTEESPLKKGKGRGRKRG